MKILAAYSIKGGVGKTACAVNLAHLAALAGARVLLWDLDPQAAATFYFRVRPKVKGGGARLLRRKRALAGAVKESDYPGLDLVPGDFSYRHLDLHLASTKKPLRRISRLLHRLQADYDLVFLDCAPSVSLVSEAVLVAADLLLVPTIPTPLSLRTLEQLRHLLADGEHETAILPFFSMVDRRKALHRTIVAQTMEHQQEFAHTVIPYSSEIERMGVERCPITARAPSSPESSAFVALWREVEERACLAPSAPQSS